MSVFETTIRALGGLLAAHSLSGEQIFLTKVILEPTTTANTVEAKDLGDRILKTMGGPHGLPCATTNLGSPSASCGGVLGLAELGTVQLELRELSALTKDPK